MVSAHNIAQIFPTLHKKNPEPTLNKKKVTQYMYQPTS